MKISVVIRNKNQSKALEFLLKNLEERYKEDIDEVIVIDNLSTDESQNITTRYNAKFITIEKFSYGGSANLAAESASNELVVIFSAHAYPVSWDFFKLIKQKFNNRENELAGLRCLHNNSDYEAFINNRSSSDDYNGAGLIFCGSVFNKKVWREHQFKPDIQTFEDKEWTKRVMDNGYKIEFCPSIYCYNIKRNRKAIFFRFKNDTIGGYQLFGTEINFKIVLKNAFHSFFKIWYNLFLDLIYFVRKNIFLFKFLICKPPKL